MEPRQDSSPDISTFEIEHGQTSSRDRPLKASRAFENPLPEFTRGMKPSSVKQCSYRCLIIIPVIFYILVSGLTIYQITLVSSPMMAEFEGIRGVLDNTFTTSCAMDPITDIKALPGGSNCTGDYELAHIGGWPGTGPGCLEKRTGKMWKGYCDFETSDVWYNFKPTEARNFTIWKGSTICIRRLKDYKRQDFENCNQDGGDKYHMCWANPGFYCVPKGQKCPISKIEKVDKIPENPESDWTYLELRKGHYLRYQNEAKSVGILADLGSSLTTKPCLDPSKNPSRISSRGYPLLDIDVTGCGMYGIDEDSRMIDSQLENDWYRENGLQLLDHFPYEAIPGIYDKVALIAKYEKVEIRHLGCNMCSKDFNWRLQTGDDEINILNRYYRRYSKIGAILVTAMICVLIYNIIMYIKHRDDLEVMNKKTWTVNLIMLGFLLGHYITAGAFAALSYFELSKAATAIDLMVEWKCFQNNNINKALADFHNDFLKMNLKITVESIFVIVVSLVSVILFLIADYMLHDVKTKENLKAIREEVEHRVPINTKN